MYVRNQGPRILGTAWDSKLIVLTWDLKRPEDIKKQAVQKKRRI